MSVVGLMNFMFKFDQTLFYLKLFITYKFRLCIVDIRINLN